MSAIIKRRDLSTVGTVRVVAIDPFDLLAQPEPDSGMIDPVAVERAALAAEVGALRCALKQATDDAEVATRKAYENGRRDGLRDAVEREADRINAFGVAIGEAVQAFTLKLEAVDGLAATLARQALAKMFEDTHDFAPMVEAMLARRLRELRAGSAIAIQVSAKDFVDTAAMEELAGLTGVSAIAVEDSLAAGDCRIDLKLGHIDLSVQEHWGLISDVLEELAGQASA